MYSVLLALYLIVSIILIGLILLQHGKGASMGASFGAGASNTVFGSVGSGNFLTHSTAVMAALFFIISLGITALYAHQDHGNTDFDNLQSIADQAAAEAPKKDEGVTSDLPTENSDVGVKAIDETKPAAGAVTEEKSEAAVSRSADLSEQSGAVEQQASEGAAELREETDALKQKAADEAAKLKEETDALKQKAADEAVKLKEETDALKQKAADETAKLKEQAEALKQQAADGAAKLKEETDALKQKAADETAKLKEQAEALKQQAADGATKLTEQQSEAAQQTDAVLPKE
jgi:preprotein translocase subunit SecG